MEEDQTPLTDSEIQKAIDEGSMPVLDSPDASPVAVYSNDQPDPVTVFAGEDRYDTSAKQALGGWDSCGTVLVVSGGGWPDALGASGLAGAEIVLSIPSVGATENAMLAAIGAKGVTTVSNAAREPEIVDLQAFLQKLGASVHGAGTSTVVIEGAEEPLHGCCHRILGDRIAAATYLAAAAASGGDIFLRDVDYRHLSTVTGVLRQAGCGLVCRDDGIRLTSDGHLRAVSPIRTAPYPGFPTDAQAVLMASLLRSSGTTVFVENIFESRYRHVPELVRMGADIRLEGRVAVVCGVDRLHAARVRAMDLRGGAALVIAGLQAHGVTTVEHLHHIRRGYSDLPGDLARLGAHIHTDITEGGASNDPTPQAQTQPPPEAAGQPCVSL